MHVSVRETAGVTVDAAAWVVAADEVRREFAVAEPDAPHDAYLLLVERVLRVADADLVTLVAPTSTRAAVTCVAAAGADARHWQGMTVPVDGTLAGSVLRSGQPRRLRTMAEHLGDDVSLVGRVEAMLAIPLPAADSVRAVLTIGRRSGRAPFTETDLALATLFAGQVALALTHRDEHERLERAVLAGERDRIARGMQTHVIAPLFGLGMRLQGAAGVASGAAARQLEAGSDEIDETIKAIRATVYRLAD